MVRVGIVVPTAGQYLTRDQARYVYKKVETGETIDVDMVQQEIEQEKQLNRMDDRNGEINPYRELIFLLQLILFCLKFCLF